MPNALYSTEMIRVINNKDVSPSTFFSDTFFNSEVSTQVGGTQTFDIIDVAAQSEMPSSGYGGEALPIMGDTFNRGVARFSELRFSRTVTPASLMGLAPGRTGFETETDVFMIQQIHAESLQRQVATNIEAMAVRALKTGVTSVLRNNSAYDVLYQSTPFTASMSGNEWNASGAAKDYSGVFTDINAWIAAVAVRGGKVPNTLVLGSGVETYFMKAVSAQSNSLVRDLNLDTRRFDSQSIRYLGTFSGLNVYSCHDSTLLGAKDVIIGSKGENMLYFGPTFIPTTGGPMVEGMTAGNGVTIYQGRMSMFTSVSANPVGYETIIQCAPLPLLIRPADVYYLTGVVL